LTASAPWGRTSAGAARAGVPPPEPPHAWLALTALGLSHRQRNLCRPAKRGPGVAFLLQPTPAAAAALPRPSVPADEPLPPAPFLHPSVGGPARGVCAVGGVSRRAPGTLLSLSGAPLRAETAARPASPGRWRAYLGPLRARQRAPPPPQTAGRASCAAWCRRWL
jgi:hypothetical protein